MNSIGYQSAVASEKAQMSSMREMQSPETIMTPSATVQVKEVKTTANPTDEELHLKNECTRKTGGYFAGLGFLPLIAGIACFFAGSNFNKKALEYIAAGDYGKADTASEMANNLVYSAFAFWGIGAISIIAGSVAVCAAKCQKSKLPQLHQKSNDGEIEMKNAQVHPAFLNVLTPAEQEKAKMRFKQPA